MPAGYYHDFPKGPPKGPLKPDERKAAMNLIAADGPVYAAANHAYLIIAAAIDERATSRKPLPKDYEVHHERMVAQDAFLRAILSGGDIPSAAHAARRAVSLPIPAQ